jgi:4-amino-4-deoxy-L-arabinose transferase-like glycosyltransferase
VTRPTLPAAALLLALVARLGFLAVTRHYRLSNDPADYQRIAASLATGHGFGRSVVAGVGPSAFRPPLYPGALGALYAVTGVHLGVARVAQALLGTVTVALIGLLACQLTGRRTAVIAMVVAACYPPLLMIGGALLSENLAVPLELAAVCALLRARRATSPWPWLAATGVLLGLGVLNRPNTALLVVPMGLLALGAAPDRRRRFGALAMVAGLAVVTTVPWLVRDEHVFHRFVPITTQGGLVMAGTYNPVSAGDHRYPAAWRPATLVPSYVASLRRDPPVGEVALERRFRTLALDYLRHHPLYPVEVAVWNTIRLFELTGPAFARLAAGAIGYSHRVSDLSVYAYYVVAALAVAGIVVGSPRRVPLGVWLVPVAVVVSTVFLQGETRMRADVDPFLILLAATALDRLVSEREKLATRAFRR